MSLINLSSCSKFYHTQNTPRRVDAILLLGEKIDKPSTPGATPFMEHTHRIGRSPKHGHHTRKFGRTKEYVAWDHMRSRCKNPKYANYKSYGGRGIKVCERWQTSFENFIADMGMAPTRQHSLDRINVNGDYEPLNCRWATQQEQQSNRRDSFYIEHGGQIKTLSEWGRHFNMSTTTIRDRYVRGLRGGDLFYKGKYLSPQQTKGHAKGKRKNRRLN